MGLCFARAVASLALGITLAACLPNFDGLSDGVSSAAGKGGSGGGGSGGQSGAGGQSGSSQGGSAGSGGAAGDASGGSAGSAGSAGATAGTSAGEGGEGGAGPGGQGGAGDGGQGGGPGGASAGDGGSAGDAGSAGDGGSAGSAGSAVCQEGGVLDCPACTCADGTCKQTTLASGSDADVPWAVVASSNGVYWTNRDGGAVQWLPTGGGPPQKIATATHPRGLVALDDGVAWTDDKGLWMCSKPDCSGGSGQVAPSVGSATIQGVTSDGQRLFWTDHGPDTSTNTGSVFWCPIADCSQPKELSKTQFVPQTIVLNGDWVIWANLGTGQTNGSIYKISKSGGDEQSITAAITLPTGLAADDTYVYWTEATPQGRVWRCPHTQGYCEKPEDMAPSAGPQATPTALTLAGGRLYWSTSEGGLLQSCPQAGCKDTTPKLHASGLDGARGIWVNSSCLFWVDATDGGNVAKVRR